MPTRYGSISLTAVGDGLGPALDDRLAEADDAGVGVDLQEQPARLDEEGLELGDLEAAPGIDGGVLLLGGHGGRGQSDGPRGERFTSVHGSLLGRQPAGCV